LVSVVSTFEEVDEELDACVNRRLQQGAEHQPWIDSHHVEPSLPPVCERRLF